jgi:hypothetical protein
MILRAARLARSCSHVACCQVIDRLTVLGPRLRKHGCGTVELRLSVGRLPQPRSEVLELGIQSCRPYCASPRELPLQSVFVPNRFAIPPPQEQRGILPNNSQDAVRTDMARSN